MDSRGRLQGGASVVSASNLNMLKSTIQRELMEDTQIGNEAHLGSLVALVLLECAKGKYQTLEDLREAIEKL